MTKPKQVKPSKMIKEITVFVYACVVSGALLYLYYSLIDRIKENPNEKLLRNAKEWEERRAYRSMLKDIKELSQGDEELEELMLKEIKKDGKES